MTRNPVWLIPIALLVALATFIDLPGDRTYPLPWGSEQTFNLSVHEGLDLQGGLQVLLEADLAPGQTVTGDQMNTARNIIENRVNGLGVTEPLVQRQGSSRILVELPGIDNPDAAIGTLRQTGLLEFVDVGSFSPPPGTPLQTDFGLSDGEETLVTPTAGADAASEATTPPTEGVRLTPSEGATTPESGASATAEAQATATSQPTSAPTELPEGPIYHTVMTGAALETAVASRDELGRPGVSFTLTDEGEQVFSAFTSANVGRYLAIVLDKQVISAPVIQGPITGGSGQITGSFTTEEANLLAIQLRYGSLPVALKVVNSQTVGPSLGQDSLRKSTVAGIIGVSVVVLFMALYYRLPGLVANIALIVYALFTFALFKLIPVTLTLPGIAGFILSVGVAVDANILIFERLKEELRGGRSLFQAVDTGFTRAWPSIRDSNLSTLITCAILYWFGSTFGASIVKGFALTLAIGVGVSLFTAITVTRLLLHAVLDRVDFTERHSWFGV